MVKSIFDKVNKTNDRAGLLEYKLGDPHRKPLLIQYLGLSELKLPIVTKEFLISPPPKITTPTRRLLDLIVGNENSQVVVSLTDKVAEVSRSYSYETFIRPNKERVLCYIDPPLVDGKLDTFQNPDRWRVLYVSDDDCCHWKLILRREKD